MFRRPVSPAARFFGLAAALALAACATPQGGSGPDEIAAESGGDGIQTRAIRSAPAAQQARNESRPLSELNTPAAVAAREEAERSGLAPPPAAPKAPAARPAGAKPGAKPAAKPAAPAAARAPALQKGAKVRLRAGAPLLVRPSVGSESAPAVAAEFELGPQIYNAGGYWWYVSSGKESGWVLQTDIQP